MSQMKPMISKKGSQEVRVVMGDGCVVIWAVDRRRHLTNSVTVFDELLPGLIARLSTIAITRAATLRAPEQSGGELDLPEPSKPGFPYGK
jgi:hypothetical protein